MYILRCKYLRGKEVKFISHLDLMRAVERAVRRAGIPVDFSEGFNPRPKIVFALPLPVGVTSSGEYADFTFSEKISVDKFIQSINSELPEGIKIISAEELQAKGSIMADVRQAEYELIAEYEGTFEHAKALMEDILAKRELIADKKLENGIKKLDIRPMIKDMQLRRIEEDVLKPNDKGNNTMLLIISARVSAGSRENLRPDLLAAVIEGSSGDTVRVLEIHRKRLILNNE